MRTLFKYVVLSQAVVICTIANNHVVIAQATSGPKVQTGHSAQSIEEVIVLGTRRTGKDVIQSSVPVDVITSKDIERTGFTQTVELIQSLIQLIIFAPRNCVVWGQSMFWYWSMASEDIQHRWCTITNKQEGPSM